MEIFRFFLHIWINVRFESLKEKYDFSPNEENYFFKILHAFAYLRFWWQMPRLFLMAIYVFFVLCQTKIMLESSKAFELDDISVVFTSLFFILFVSLFFPYQVWTKHHEKWNEERDKYRKRLNRLVLEMESEESTLQKIRGENYLLHKIFQYRTKHTPATKAHNRF